MAGLAGPSFAHAAAAQSAAVRAKPYGEAQVRSAVAAYAKKRGVRPQDVQVEVLGLTKSGKSTRATLKFGGQEVTVAVNHGTGRVQTRQTSSFVSMIVAAHKPPKRAIVGESSRFAKTLVDFSPGEGTKTTLSPAPHGTFAALGKPRAGQSLAAQSLDAVPLGRGGSATVGLAQALTMGNVGAGVRVRENGIGDSTGTIINQTPGLVEVQADGKWYRLGYAGYQTAGDVLLLANALDALPAGSSITNVRVTDAPNAPSRGVDPTNNAVAEARGVYGFDLVSVEGIPGATPVTVGTHHI